MSSTTVALVGLWRCKLSAGQIESYYVVPLFVALFILPMIALGDTMEGTARANSWAFVALSPTYIIRPTLILVFMLAAVWYGAPQTAETAMLASLAAAYVTTVGQFFNITWRLRRRFEKGPAKVEFAPWFRVALPIFLIEGFGFPADQFRHGRHRPLSRPPRSAIYFAASKTMALVQFVYFSVKAATAPHFSALFAGEHAATLPVLRPERALGVLAEPACRADGAGSRKFPARHVRRRVYRRLLVMVILFFGIMCKASVGPGEVLLTMAGQQALCVKLYVVALAANIGLNVLLIPLYGIQGAAFAAALAMLVEAVLLHVAVRSRKIHSFSPSRGRWNARASSRMSEPMSPTPTLTKKPSTPPCSLPMERSARCASARADARSETATEGRTLSVYRRSCRLRPAGRTRLPLQPRHGAECLLLQPVPGARNAPSRRPRNPSRRHSRRKWPESSAAVDAILSRKARLFDRHADHPRLGQFLRPARHAAGRCRECRRDNRPLF
jgi:hypothetical protein